MTTTKGLPVESFHATLALGAGIRYSKECDSPNREAMSSVKGAIPADGSMRTVCFNRDKIDAGAIHMRFITYLETFGSEQIGAKTLKVFPVDCICERGHRWIGGVCRSASEVRKRISERVMFQPILLQHLMGRVHSKHCRPRNWTARAVA